MKIVSVLGARPQFVKAYPFSREVRNHSGVREVLVHTEQHYTSKLSPNNSRLREASFIFPLTRCAIMFFKYLTLKALMDFKKLNSIYPSLGRVPSITGIQRHD